MQVADIIRLRMSQLGMDIQELSNTTLIDEKIIRNLISNN